MPISPRQKLLCSYRYDALDRSIDWAPIGQAGIQRFHCNDHLATEIQGSVKHSIFQHDDHVLAQQQHMDDQVDTTLLTTDLQGSILNALDAHRPHSIAYTPYGYLRPGNGLLSLLGFNGERPDPVTGHYHLGYGYRQFNPVLMRFNSPDSLSPFGKGGLNAYAYCGGNPVTNVDPSGRTLADKVIKTMTSNIKKRTNRLAISPETHSAIIDTQPINSHGDGVRAQNEVIDMLVQNNQLGPSDHAILLGYRSAKYEEALSMVSAASKHKKSIRKRFRILRDAVEGVENSASSLELDEMKNYRRMLSTAVYDLHFKAGYATSERTRATLVNTASLRRPSLPDNPPTYEETERIRNGQQRQ